MAGPSPIVARPEHRHGDRLAALGHIRCPFTGRSLELRRAWPRDRGHLLLEYLDPDLGGIEQSATTVAGQWFADGDRLRAVASQTASAAPRPGLVATLDDVGVVLQRGGADRRLRALGGLLGGPGARLMVHRPERRAVVRLERSGATSYLKVVPAGRLSVPRLEGWRPLRTPAVISCDEATGTIEHAEQPGVSLHSLLSDPVAPNATVVRALQGTGTLLRGLHATTLPAGLGTHDAEAEIAVASRWLDHALAHRVLRQADVEPARAALARVVVLLMGHERPSSMALVHRDLHDKQVLVTADGEVGVLDLDTLAKGDPAVDVANLLAHLELRSLQGQCSPDRADLAAVAFVDGYRPDRALRARLTAYTAATRVRLACVYAFRPRWRHLARHLLTA